MITNEHYPTDWRMVSAGDHSVTCIAMCKCGDDKCYFTATSYKSNWTHIKEGEVA